MSLRSRLINLGATGFILTAASALGPTEALRLVPYDDIGGVRTWCYGQTVGIPKARYSEAECDADLLRTVGRYWTQLQPYVPTEAPASVKAAMLHVAYNTGVPGWKHPVFLGPLAKHDWQGACNGITALWQGKHGVAKGFKATVKGHPAKGLENRRAKEYAICIQDL